MKNTPLPKKEQGIDTITVHGLFIVESDLASWVWWALLNVVFAWDMRMRWGWFWFDEQDELRSSRRPCCVSTGKNPLKKYPRPYAARVLLCDRAAAVSLVFALCRHNIKICQRREGIKTGGRCYSRAADMKAESVPEAVELMKKQRSARHLQPWPNTARGWVERPNKKAKEKSRLKAAESKEPSKQPGEKATQKPKSENRSRKPKRRTKTKRAYL